MHKESSGNPSAGGARGDSPGLVERLGLHRKELRAWAMYDWANSAFMTTIVAAVFPAYFGEVAAAGLPEGAALARFGTATTIAIIIIAVLSPLLGTIGDYTGTRKKLLAGFMAVGTVAVAGMYFIQYGDWLPALILFGIASIGATGSFVFYDALLPHLAGQEEVDRVSTAGFALGYVGGGLLLALNLWWIMNPGLFGLPSGEGLTESQETLPVRLALLSVAVWWVVFSIPLFRSVKEPPRDLRHDVKEPGSVLAIAFRRLVATFRELRRYRQAFLMLLAFLVYSDGIGTIIRMATLYGTEIGIPRDAMIAAILITQFVGIPFAFLFGMLAGRIGTKKAILLGLFVYMGITVIGYSMTTATHFLLLAVLVGMVQGGTQALSRSLYATLIPAHKSGQFFGFYGVLDRFAGSMGSAVMAVMAVLTGSARSGILAVVVFFLAGALLLSLVDVEKGRETARRIQREREMEEEAAGAAS